MNAEKRKDYFTSKRNDYKSRIAASAFASVIILVASLFFSYMIYNNNNREKPIVNPDVSQLIDSSSEINSIEQQESSEAMSNDESVIDESIETSYDEVSEPNIESDDESIDDDTSIDEESQEESVATIYGETFNNIYVYGDTAVTLLGGSASNEEKFAKLVNDFKNKLGDTINLYTAIVPTYVDFYKNGEGKRVTTAHQDEIIPNIYYHIN